MGVIEDLHVEARRPGLSAGDADRPKPIGFRRVVDERGTRR